MQQRNNNGSMNACSLFSIFLPPSERCSLNDQSFFSKEKNRVKQDFKILHRKTISLSSSTCKLHYLQHSQKIAIS